MITRLLSFAFRPDFSTLIMLCIAVLAAVSVYFAYARAAMKSGLRGGQNPNGVRLGAYAFALSIFALLMSFVSGMGFGPLLIAFLISLGLAAAGRNRVIIFVLLCIVAALAVAIRLFFSK
jgi:hypothetical protein